MIKLTKEEAINLGGKVWKKEDIERVYLSIQSINKLLDMHGYANQKINLSDKGIKIYLDSNKGLISDKGIVRSTLNGCGIYCGK